MLNMYKNNYLYFNYYIYLKRLLKYFLHFNSLGLHGIIGFGERVSPLSSVSYL